MSSTKPLASWNDGPATQAIIEFVTVSATEGSTGFIPAADRIAAFDNDGTMWVEQPAPVQIDFLLQKFVMQAQADPLLASKQPYKAIIEKDQSFFADVAVQKPEAIQSLLEAIGKAWEGTTPDEFEADVKEFLATAKDKKFGRAFTDLVYQPMLELFDFLKANDYRVYVCSGGGRDFMRVISEDSWRIGKEYVIGTDVEYEYKDGKFVRQAKLHGGLALGPGKPEHIFARTGRVAAFAAGNADVDIEMLETAQFSLLIVHDDDGREYAYTKGAEKSVVAAKKHGWTLVSVKNDWKTVFVAPKGA